MSKTRKSKPAARASVKSAKGSVVKNRLPKERKVSPKESASKVARLIERKQSELLTADRQRSTAATDWAIAHAHAAELKKYLDKKQAEVNQIISEIRNIKSGNYTPSLFDDGAGANGKAETNGHAAPADPAIDEGVRQPLSALIEFGMTEAKVDKLKETIDGATIGDLEKYQREHQDWHRNLKGFGEEWLTKLQDAHLAFRKKMPMPDPVQTASEKAAKAEATRTAEETPVQKAEKLGAEAALAGAIGKVPEQILREGPECVDAWLKGYDAAKGSAPAPAAVPTKTTQAKSGKYDGPEYASNRNRAETPNPIPTDGMRKALAAGREARNYGTNIGCPDLPPDEAKAWTIGYTGDTADWEWCK